MNSLTFFLTKCVLRPRHHKKIRFEYLIMILGIVVSVGVVCAAVSLFEGYQRSLKKVLLDFNSHILVFSGVNNSLNPEQIDNITAILSPKSDVRSVQPVYSNAIMAKNEDLFRSGYIKTYDNDETGAWRKFLTENTVVKDGYVILGQSMAEDLNLETGNSVSLVTPTSTYTPIFGQQVRQRDFKVGGMIKSGHYEIDKSMIIMSSTDAYSFYGIEPMYTHLEIFLKDKKINSADKISTQFQQILGPEYQVNSWIDYNGDLFSLITVQKWIIFLVFSLLILIASLNCVSIVTASILDHKKEIAILKTIGVTRRQLHSIYYSRIFAISIVSVIVGLAVGTAAAWAITKQPFYQLRGEVYFIEALSMHVSVVNYLAVFAMSLIIIAICVKIPLKYINRFEVIDVLRGNI